MRFVEPHAPGPLRKPPEKLQWGQCQFPNVSCRRRQDSRTLPTLRYYETAAQETTEEPNWLNGTFRQFSKGWRDSDGASGRGCRYVRSLQKSLQSSERLVVGKFHPSEWYCNTFRYVIHAPLPSTRFRVIHESIFESHFALFILENKGQFIFLRACDADRG
jgi:hypothetical protein